MQPNNYNLDVGNPFQSALQGYGAGVAVQKSQLELQGLQQAQEQQVRQQKLLSELAASPTADNYAKVMTLMPGMSEHLGRAWTVQNDAQQENFASFMLQLGVAYKNGRPEIADSMMEQRAHAIENSGDKQKADGLRAMAQAWKGNPAFAQGSIQAMLAANPKGKQAADTLASFGGEQRAADKAPAELAEAAAKADKTKSEAKTAGVTAQFAEQNAVQELVKKGWDIKVAESDVQYKKDMTRIAVMNADLAKETNALKKQELQIKVDEAKVKLDEKIREKAQQAEVAAESIDNMINTIERVKKNPALNAVIGSLEGRDFYPHELMGQGTFAASADERADAIALIETLDSQAFLSQITKLKGMGQLSDQEGKRLTSGLQNLSRKQSEKQFTETLDETVRLLIKTREGVSKATGVPLGKPDTPAAPGARPPLASFDKPAGG